MSDVTLHDGRELTFDLYQMTVREWNTLIDLDNPPTREYEYGLIAKCCELAAEDIQELPLPDYQKLTRAFFKKVTTPEEAPKVED